MKKNSLNKLLSFIKKYNENFINLAYINADISNNLIKLFHICHQVKKNKKKIIIAGNGGSSAIASHFSVDMTKNAGVRCINFNESDLITCFSNDYGYENWVRQALKFYYDEGDLVILISSSGNSSNIINAAKFLKTKKNKLVIFTGFNGKNLLSRFGSLKFVVNSNNYNIIENTHQYWLLTLIDLFTKFKD